MVLVDTGNGMWIARLLLRSDLAGETSARAMTLTVAYMNLRLGIVLVCSCVSSSFDEWLTAHELGVSFLVVLATVCAYGIGL
jgi:hypothetical protein